MRAMAFGGVLWMRAMADFDHILNWKLQPGSHKFPGQDGGTCINEAAIVAAGFPYQAVKSVEEMPTCFSRPICRLAMRLNDEATDEQRQRLLPFVTRLEAITVPLLATARNALAGCTEPAYAPNRPIMRWARRSKPLGGAHELTATWH